jgi:sulfoxide reductase heme-binding subunit YedZ
MKRRKTHPLQIAAHIGSWIPLIVLLYDFSRGALGPDIIRSATLRTGKTALVLLVLSLACTPVNLLTKYKPVIRIRKPLGLYSFMYASIHFSIFIGVDYFFNFVLIKDALLEKRFALAGLAAGLILLILAITSTNGWKKRLKKKWKPIHKLVYIAGVLVIIHFIWLVKPGVVEPWYWAVGMAFLFILRLKPVKKFISERKSHLSKLWKKQARKQSLHQSSLKKVDDKAAM